MAALGSFAAGGLGFGLAFTLKDKFTKTAKQIEKGLDGLSGRTATVQKSVNNSLNGIKVGAIALGLGAALIAPLTLGITRIATLDDLMADVRKTTGLTNTEALGLKNTLQGIDTRTSLEDLLDISRIGGQIGVAKGELAGFTQEIDKAVVALGDEFTGGAEQVASELGKINSIFKIDKLFGTAEGINKIGSAINELGANGLATAPFLSNFTKRLGPVAVDAGISAQNILGLSAALEQLGGNPEESASGISRLFNVLTTKTDKAAKAVGISTSAFTKMLNTDANEAMLTFSKRLKEANPNQVDFKKQLQEIGLTGVGLSKTMAMLSGNTDLVREKQSLANKAFDEGTSLTNEFNLKNNTLVAGAEKLKKVFLDIAESLSRTLEPAMRPILSLVTGMAKAFLWFTKTKVGKFVLGLTAVLGTLLVVLGAVTLAVNGARLGLMKMATALFASRAKAIQFIIANKGIVVGMKVMARQAWLTATAMLAAYWPVAIVVGVIAGAVWGLNKIFKTSTNSFDSFLAGGEKAKGIMNIFQRIGGVVRAVFELFKNEKNGVTFLSPKMAEKLKSLGILDFVVKLSTWVSRLKAFWNGLMLGFRQFSDIVGPVLENLFSAFSSIFEAMGFDIFKLTGSLEDWGAMGLFVANTVLQPLIFGLKSVAFVFKIVAVSVSLLIGLFDTILEKFALVRGGIGDIFEGKFGSALTKGLKFFGVGGDEEENVVGAGEQGSGGAAAALQLANNSAAPSLAAAGQRAANVNTNVTGAPINVSLNIDSDKVAEKVIEKQEFASAVTNN